MEKTLRVLPNAGGEAVYRTRAVGRASYSGTR